MIIGRICFYLVSRFEKKGREREGKKERRGRERKTEKGRERRGCRRERILR